MGTIVLRSGRQERMTGKTAITTFRRTSIGIFFLGLLTAPGAAQGQSAGDGDARLCTASANDTATTKKSKKDRERDQKGSAAAAAPACLELRATTLDVQEYLQSYIRKKQWRIADETMSEDFWAFSRELDKEELLAFTKPDPKNAEVHWSGGKALIRISTQELSDGFHRTVIRADFRGFGETADHFAQPKPWWDLDSNRSLENSLISALQSYFRSRR